MSFLIRPFAPADYEAIAAVLAAAFAPTPSTADELRHEDDQRPAHCKAQRWVAEADGQVVATAAYFQYAGRYHPRKFFLDLAVHPGVQGRGIGTALYATVMEGLRVHDPISLQIQCREDLPRGIAFATRRGFVEKMRVWESELDLSTFDPTPWLPYAERAAQHVQIKSLRELESDPERNAKLLDVVNIIRCDLPSTEPATPLTYEHFMKQTFEHPSFLPDGYMVAVAPDGQYVGVSVLWRDSGDGILWTGLTGLRREYRGLGIAQALKLRALLWAKQQGARGVRTFNESNNARMLAINQQMGFVRKPAWIDYVLTLKAE